MQPLFNAVAACALLGLARADGIDDLLMTAEQEEEERLTREAMAEAIGADRGMRQEDGTREEWERQADHTGRQYDSKKRGARTLEQKLSALLRTNELSCDGCSIEEMKDMLNRAVEIRAEREEQRLQRKNLLESASALIGVGLLAAIAFFIRHSSSEPK